MLEIENLTKKFGDKKIFEKFNLTINDSETLVILGPSGGGKTTLLRMLAGLEVIDSGSITFNGDKTTLKQEYFEKNLLGFVFQDFQLFPHKTVLDNLILSPIYTQNLPKNEAIVKAKTLLKNLDLEGFEKSYPYSLSGGQKQRVALARAMMINPKIIGYDEPTSALDSELRNQVADLILKNKQLGITQIVVTHDSQFADKIADKIIKVNPRN